MSPASVSQLNTQNREKMEQMCGILRQAATLNTFGGSEHPAMIAPELLMSAEMVQLITLGPMLAVTPLSILRMPAIIVVLPAAITA